MGSYASAACAEERVAVSRVAPHTGLGTADGGSTVYAGVGFGRRVERAAGGGVLYLLRDWAHPQLGGEHGSAVLQRTASGGPAADTEHHRAVSTVLDGGFNARLWLGLGICFNALIRGR